MSNALGISAVTAVLEYLLNSVYPASGLGSVTVVWSLRLTAGPEGPILISNAGSKV